MSQTYTTLGTLFTAIANAIRAKTGSSAQIKADDFPTEIANIPTGGGTTISSLSVTQNGTYTAPAGTAYTPVTVNVGGSIIPSDLPSDGKIRVCYDIPANALSTQKTITFMFYQNANSSTSVDWGDGSAAVTNTTAGRKTLTHTYSATGEHIVTLTVNTGSVYFGGGQSYTIYGNYASYQCNYIKWAVLGSGVSKLDTYAFYTCVNLQEIRLPSSGLTEIKGNAFQYCSKLKAIEIPNTVTSMGAMVFQYCVSLKNATLPSNSSYTVLGSGFFGYCYNLESVTLSSYITEISSSGALLNCYNLKSLTLPSNITTLGTECFNRMYSLKTLTIPNKVTSIGTSALANARSLGKLRFDASSPPTVSNSNTFTNLPTTCVISVPTGKLSAYTSAANYPSNSTYTYIQE